jgi:hypothetical protein
MMNGGLVTHLESYLGPISGGFSEGSAQNAPFQVARFDDGLISDYSAIATLGLSHHLLDLGVSDKRTRQELLILIPQGSSPGAFPGMLRSIGEMCIKAHRGFRKGEIIEMGAPLAVGSKCVAFIAMQPVYYPNEFVRYEESGKDPVVIVWLIPITSDEVKFVRSHGVHRFEHELIEYDPDLTDLGRPSIASM